MSRADPWPRGRSRDGGIDEIPLPGVTGRLWLCGHRVVGPDPEAALARVGGDAIVCLCQRHELADRYPDYVEWLDSADPDRATWFPTPDLGVRPVDEFLVAVDAVVERLRSGRAVIVHCAAGIGRSGTLAAGVLLRLGLDHDRALAEVAAHRPTAGPEVGAQADLIRDVAARPAVEAPDDTPDGRPGVSAG
ncbi:MAG: tyrosine-protein phosphatase [Actinomycetota bacterium]